MTGKSTRYRNMETGELFENVAYVVTEEQAKKAKEKKTYEKLTSNGENLKFTFSFMDQVKELTLALIKDKGIKSTYLGYLLMLQTYIRYKDNVLYKNQQSAKPLKRTDIGEVLSVSNRSKLKAFLDTMIEKEILQEVKTDKGEGFKFNEKYAIRGKVKDNRIVKVFTENMRQLYKDNPAEDVSFLYTLLPYISYLDNVVAFNPHEPDPSLIEVMSIKDMAEVTGLSEIAVKKKKNRMRFNGMYVFKSERKGNTYNHVVNPLLFYRKPYEPDQTLVRSFLIRGK